MGNACCFPSPYKCALGKGLCWESLVPLMGLSTHPVPGSRTINGALEWARLLQARAAASSQGQSLCAGPWILPFSCCQWIWREESPQAEQMLPTSPHRLLHAEAGKPLLWQGGRSQLPGVPVGLAEPCTLSPLYFQLGFYFPSLGGDPHVHAHAQRCVCI